MIDALLTPAEAAKLLATSVKTLSGHAEEGSIARIVIGHGTKKKRYAFDPADVEAFKRSRREYGRAPLGMKEGRSRKLATSGPSSGVIAFEKLRARIEAEHEMRKAERKAKRGL